MVSCNLLMNILPGYGMGCRYYNLILPKHFSPDQLQDEILALINKNRHHKIARIRLTVFRGDGGLYDPENHTPNYIIQTWACLLKQAPGTVMDWYLGFIPM